MYLLFMIKARIRWCTCRVENILTLGKLLSLWFCFLLHSILFLISQTSYHTYKNNFKLCARSPHNGNHFSSICINMCVCRGPISVGGITWAKRAHAQSQY